MIFTRTGLAATGLSLILSGPVLSQDTAIPTDEPATATTEPTTAPAQATVATDDPAVAPAEPTAAPVAPEVAKIVATAETVVATVNGIDITVGHIVALGARLPQEYQSLDTQTLFDGILDQLIQQSLLAARVDSSSKALKYAIENESRALLATEAINDIGNTAVTEQAVLAAYKDQYTDIERAQDFSVSHILVETEDVAKAIVVELEGGADFAETAKEKSIGPSKVDGGDLGWISTGQTVAPFEEAVRTLEPGQVSAPTQTQFGWHIIKLAEFRDAVPPALTEVREAIEADLSDKAIEASMRILDEGATIVRMDDVIDAGVVSDATLLDQ